MEALAAPPVGLRLVATSWLYESPPAYVTDQPAFLNAALVGETALGPLALLAAAKEIEAGRGRDLGPAAQRHGPRPLDIDLVFYGGRRLTGPALTVPHPGTAERPFVLAPLTDLADALAGAETAESMTRVTGVPVAIAPGVTPALLRGGSVAGDWEGDTATALLLESRQRWADAGGEASLGAWGLARVTPLPSLGPGGAARLLPYGRGCPTLIMAVLNVTPDSFSDGGGLSTLEAAVAAARRAAAEGADVLDIGGQSTRPGAVPVALETELARVLPVIQALAADPELAAAGVGLSVDTFVAGVAGAATRAGAGVINDVSGGGLDAAMGGVVAGAPTGGAYVVGHMRGDPRTMQSRAVAAYPDEAGGVLGAVGRELARSARAAADAGVTPWRLWLDPGLGFAKSTGDTWGLMRGLPELGCSLGTAGSPAALGRAFLLVGPSRKAFLGGVTGRAAGPARDAATAAAVAACVSGGADGVRVHDVKSARDAARVADAVWKGRE